MVHGLATTITQASNTYKDTFKKLGEQIQKVAQYAKDQAQIEKDNIEDHKEDEREMAFWHGFLGAFEAIAGVVACCVGAPELGAPLIAGAVAET